MSLSDERGILERESVANLAMSISQILTASEPLEQILQQCVESLIWHLDLAFARIWLLDSTERTLVLAASAGLSTNLHGTFSRIPVATSLKIGRVVRERRPHLTNRLHEETWVRDQEWVTRERLIAYAGYPLIARDRVVGVMAMFSRHELGERTLDELGGIAGGIAQCVRRCQAEDELRANERRLSLAVAGSGMALWEWEFETEHMVWSPQFFSLLGYAPSTITPCRTAWEQRLRPEDRDRVIGDIARSRSTGTPLSHDYRIITADTGEVVWVAGRGTFVSDGAGMPRLIGALFNINHRKRTEAEIQRLLEQAERTQDELRDKQAQLVQNAKLASIGELTTGLAHELNNPLNNIGLFVGNALDILSEHENDDFKERLVTYLHAAEEQVNRAASIIHHLRIFGRSSRRNFTTLQIDAVIRTALASLVERIRMAGVDLVDRLDAEHAYVEGCRIQLEQALVNLFTNALDAMKASSTKVLTVSSRVVDGVVRISITDSGDGIAPDNLPRVFDSFFTTKEVGEGTGLGLSIAFGIIKAHRGEITMQSSPGQGTEVTIHLPLSKHPC